MRNPPIHFLKRILVPTDFSIAAEHAIEYACQFAMKSSASILLYHSLQIPVIATNGMVEVFSSEELENDTLLMLDQLRSKIKKKFPSLDVEIKTTVGFTVDEINSVAGKQQANLIIMGTKGA